MVYEVKRPGQEPHGRVLVSRGWMEINTPGERFGERFAVYYPHAGNLIEVFNPLPEAR